MINQYGLNEITKSNINAIQELILKNSNIKKLYKCIPRYSINLIDDDCLELIFNFHSTSKLKINIKIDYNYLLVFILDFNTTKTVGRLDTVAYKAFNNKAKNIINELINQLFKCKADNACNQV
ncbi:MAG TPA: hypothetical protein VN698_09265 [Bacteroidia bacterium]|nr:hypothetical protein [Bacteroidia bacterium]